VEGRATVRIREVLGAQRERLEAHRLVATERDVRRCRVATQRARAIARATRPIFGDALGPLEEELRWLGRLLGPVRDIDVLIAHVRPQIETLEEDADGARLVTAALGRQRLFRHKELKAAVGSQRYDELLVSFNAVLETLPFSDDSLRHISRGELARLRRAAKELHRVPTDDQLHVLRLRAKRARYTAELAGSVRLAKALARVQALTGTYQDAVVAEERLRSLSRPKTAQAIGRLIEREHLRKRAQRAALPAALARALRGE
jgi:CHAD domain-containing protein